MKPLHIAIVAGEQSGDVLGGALMQALRSQFANVRFSGVGGKHMLAQGLQSLADMERLSVMGLFEVIAHLPDIVCLKKEIVHFWQNDPPDLYIGIDAPDFNLRIEKIMHQRGVKTVHYVSPSLWAWKQKRIEKIKGCVDLMLCLFPFECGIYQQHKVAVACVGHPMKDRLTLMPQTLARKQLHLAEHARYVGIFPGSRKGEISRLLPVFLESFQKLLDKDPHLYGLISLSSNHHRSLVEGILAAHPVVNVAIMQEESALLMNACDALMLASGTVTLEAALLMRPMCVAYKVHPITAMLAKRLLKIDRYSLPNLLAGEDVVCEWIQDTCTSDNIAQDMADLLSNEQRRTAQIQAFMKISEKLPYQVSHQAAKAIAQLLAKVDP